MQPTGKRLVSFAPVLLVLLTAMANAATPSVEELGSRIASADHVVDFSHTSGGETPNTVDISMRPNSKLAVRLLCASGYRGVLLSVHKGSLDLANSPAQDLSSEDVMALIEGGDLKLPAGLSVGQPVPYVVPKPHGFVGAPVPFVSFIELNKPGDYSLVFSIMRVWMPTTGARYALKIHVTGEEGKGESEAAETA